MTILRKTTLATTRDNTNQHPFACALCLALVALKISQSHLIPSGLAARVATWLIVRGRDSVQRATGGTQATGRQRTRSYTAGAGRL